MSFTTFRIMKIRNIPIYINITFFLTFFFVMFILIRTAFPFGFADIESVYIKYGLSFVATFLFFALLLLHELAHSLVASYYGIAIKNITLFFFGGVSVFEEEPEKPSQELVVSAAGPLASVISGLFFIVLYLILLFVSDLDVIFSFGDNILYKRDLGTLFLNVGSLTLFLGLFNLIPIFPLDGGRILRAFLAMFQPHQKATETAAKIGQIFAIFLAIFGLFFNIWLTILALFLYLAAGAESKRAAESSYLEGVTTKEIMTKEIITVDSKTSIYEFINFVIKYKHPAYPVIENRDVVGIVSINNVHPISEAEQYALTVSDVMDRDFVAVKPETPAYETFMAVGMSPIGRALVFDDYRNLVGIVTKSDFMLYFSIKEIKDDSIKEIENDSDF